MDIIETDFKGLYIIKPKIYKDNRGLFTEVYKISSLLENNLNIKFVQENLSISKRNVLRGLHFQIPPKAHGKLIRCSKGKIFDVAVDIRKNSKTFGKYFSKILMPDEFEMIYIPEGFAHGFLSLEDNSEIVYNMTGEYSKEHERGIIWNDKYINIDWPLSSTPILSEKDKNNLEFTQNITEFELTFE